MKLKNIDQGPRGVYVNGSADDKTDPGTMLVLQPGQTSDEVTLTDAQLETAKKTEWFEFSGRGASAKTADKD